jgi:folate-binding protein YgfZ
VRIAAGRTSELPTILRGKAVSVSREDAPDVYGMLRAIYLVPETGHEIIDAYNPMEIGLSDEISFTKGCYIGQEVIARLDSYKKVQRRLCLLSSSKALRPAMASPVQYQGTGVGTVTTSASSQKRSIALAVIRIEAFEEHETLQINSWDFSIYKGSYPAYSLIDSGRGKPE